MQTQHPTPSPSAPAAARDAAADGPSLRIAAGAVQNAEIALARATRRFVEACVTRRDVERAERPAIGYVSPADEATVRRVLAPIGRTLEATTVAGRTRYLITPDAAGARRIREASQEVLDAERAVAAADDAVVQARALLGAFQRSAATRAGQPSGISGELAERLTTALGEGWEVRARDAARDRAHGTAAIGTRTPRTPRPTRAGRGGMPYTEPGAPVSRVEVSA